MDITAIFVENVSDQCLLQQLLPNRKGLVYFRYDLIDEIEFDCSAIIICHRVSSQSAFPRLPIKYNTARLVVLSDCSQEKTIVETLNAGAHHYMSLHESVQVLGARLNAALRCHRHQEYRTLFVEPYRFHQDNRTVFYENRMLNLSPREFELAYYLFTNRDRVVTDAELMMSVWTLPPSLDSRRIDTSICRIKRKMNLNTTDSRWNISRLRGQGYQVTS